MELRLFIIRITICFILSIVVGVERQMRHRMVGLRTNVLVCMGAFLFTYLSFGIDVNDKTRIAAQVVSGIGFLGAGVILRDGNKIKGLNTAATLWCVSGIGVLCAAGLIIEACIGTIFILLSNIILRAVSIRIMDRLKGLDKEKYIINISCKKNNEKDVREDIVKLINKNNLVLNSLERTEITKDDIKLVLIVITDVTEKIEEIINKISIEPGISSISWNHESTNSDNEDSDEE